MDATTYNSLMRGGKQAKCRYPYAEEFPKPTCREARLENIATALHELEVAENGREALEAGEQQAVTGALKWLRKLKQP